jgi:AraC-like DNA-binding protein
LEIQQEFRRRLSRKLGPQQICCFAGITELAVPIVIGGEHVATLVGGQVFREKPSRRRLERVIQQLRAWGMPGELKRLERAYVQTPVVSKKQFDGAVRLLAILATQLADFANRMMLTGARGEPETVIQAKRFVNARIAERVSLGETATHVHLSRNYFCKVFKRATSINFTEYVARVRVEKAKDLLANLQLRMNEVAARAGFQSISQFNRVFRRYTRCSPTAYRASLPT